MKKNLIWAAVAAAVWFGYQYWQKQPQQPMQQPIPQAVQTEGQRQPAVQILQTAYEQKQSNIQVEGSGVVVKTLPDDNKGSRHQRFILKLAGGQTLLVAHNIDLAQKIKGLKKGDTVEFYGEYEWSQQGGVIHWTHHDPQGRHADGWLKHNGVTYQ
ncbi:DUF3465 domain-containing protein [Neisseria dentiae]|uniref:DUF3465 domain-containing protein n=1 Tax=Neisseria dentiae TaxID=194197 RepID=UPI0035A02C14